MLRKNLRPKSFVLAQIAFSYRSRLFPWGGGREQEKAWTKPRVLQSPLSALTRGGQGFSVIELLVALSILSVLLFIASSTLGELAPKFALDNTVRSVAMALNQARNQAITRGHTVDVTFGSHSYEITDATDSDALLATDALSAVVGVSAGDIATFTPLGTAAAPLTITVSNDSHSRTVVVGITGEVMVQ